MAESDKEESPIAIQIYGNKPDMMAHAAQLFKIWVLTLSISTWGVLRRKSAPTQEDLH